MTEPNITSRQNPRLKQVVKLRDRRERRRTGLVLVDGSREALRALEAGVDPVEAWVDACHESPRTEAALERLAQQGVPQIVVDSDLFEKVAFGKRADGLVLVARATPLGLDGLELPPNPLVAVVEAIEKPGNLGAILRTADGVGADAVLVADPRVDLYNPNTIRASVASVFRRGIVQSDAQQARDWLREQQIALVTATPEATTLYHQADLTRPVAIVLGSEAEGLSSVWRDERVQPVRLPMLGVADSLNVAATAAVLLYEARRQRG